MTSTISEKDPSLELNLDAEEAFPLPPTDLPYDDGEPLETNRHRLAMNVLIDSVEQALSDRHDFFAGGNMFIYYSSAQVRNRDFKGPDFFVVLDVDRNPDRKSWIVWEEGGRYPDVIVELTSASTAQTDITTKKDIYQKIFRTPDYFVFDPYQPDSLRGWHLDQNQNYQLLIPNEEGRLWCQSLQLWLGTWEGTINRTEAIWLRFYHDNGVVVPLPAEAAKQEAEIAQQEAETAKQQAEIAQQEAETAKQQAAEMAKLLAKYQEKFGELK